MSLLSFHVCSPLNFNGTLFVVRMVPLKVLLPIRRGLMFQTASASSRVQAKNGIITQGIEIMSLMCKAYESVTTPTEVSAKKVRLGVQVVRRGRRNVCYCPASKECLPHISFRLARVPFKPPRNQQQLDPVAKGSFNVVWVMSAWI